MIIYYIRHSDPIYNPDSLTPLGERQAEALAKRLSVYGIDEIYSSPSVRAVRTATPLSEILKKPITCLVWCDESLTWQEFTIVGENGKKDWMFRNLNVIEKFTENSIRELGELWYKDSFFDAKVGEGVNRINAHIDNFLQGYGYKHDREKGLYSVKDGNDKRIAIIAHEGFGMAFFSSILDIPYPLFSTRFGISHSCFSVIYFPNEQNKEVFPKLLQHSNDSHLYKDGLPTKYNNDLKI